MRRSRRSSAEDNTYPLRKRGLGGGKDKVIFSPEVPKGFVAPGGPGDPNLLESHSN